MTMIQLRLVGTGDAFGSGGRLQTCFLLESPEGKALVDCGASSLIGLKREHVRPSDVDLVLLTHLHGDHFGGLPFLVLDGQFSRRVRPLVVAGPPGLQQRIEDAMEVLFPLSSKVQRGFRLSFVDLQDRTPLPLAFVTATAFTVQHASGAPSFALRVECGGRIVAYSGDTEWTDSLLDVAQGADVFICEAYFFEKSIRYHLDYTTLHQQLPRLGCRRIILTHMSEDMLDRASEVHIERALDGQILVL
jgi:ribonuclease BN (tRNA processing enzyme)